MASRGRTTYQKQQKESARRDKQERKAARRAQRKLEGPVEERTGEETLINEEGALNEEDTVTVDANDQTPER